MVKEKLKTALEDAVRHYNAGLSANDAIIKSATDNDLTLDQTDRVVESFNTAKTINFYEKNAVDRTGGFDLASKKDVTLALFGKGSSAEKKASVTDVRPIDTLADAFYARPPDRTGNRRNVFAEKRAAYLDVLAAVAAEKEKHGYSDRTLQAAASDALATIKSAESDLTAAIGTIDSYLCTATEKIAHGLTSGELDGGRDRADLFKAACPHSLVVREVSRACPMLKKASGGRYVRMAVVDTTPVDDLLKEADDIMAAVRQRAEYRTKLAEFRTREKNFRTCLFKDPSFYSIKKEASAEDFLHRPNRPSCPGRTMRKAAGESYMDMLSVSTMGNELPNISSRRKDNEKLRDAERGAILADLLSSDPILQDADPRQVAAIFKSITAASPRVSLNKEVLRSVLRGAINSIALSPNDAEVLSKLDYDIQRAYKPMSKSTDEERWT